MTEHEATLFLFGASLPLLALFGWTIVMWWDGSL